MPDLYRHLAACDLAVVQGGLTTAMELTATRRPFLYFPLGHHFEQNLHVRHRLERYRAGRCMDYETPGPAEIAAAIAGEIGREVDYRPVATDGAARAAACSPSCCSPPRAASLARGRACTKQPWLADEDAPGCAGSWVVSAWLNSYHSDISFSWPGFARRDVPDKVSWSGKFRAGCAAEARSWISPPVLPP